MTALYEKTAAGREAIRNRDSRLSRPARNLLLLIDASKTGAHWVSLVGGSTPDDLALLLRAGLIAPPAAALPNPAQTPSPTAATPATLAAPPTDAPADGLEAALAGLSYRVLYDGLTQQARARLGLIRGYRMVLEIERCAGAEDIRRLAHRFINEVRQSQGDEAARSLCRDLGAHA